MKILIVGTGRCGTKTLSNLLNQNNIKCGHESIFGKMVNKEIDENHVIKTIDLYEAESSWLAVPYLGTKYIPKETKIIHLIRDPKKVIKSFLDISLFNGKGIYYEFMKNNCEQVNDNNSYIVNAINYYLYWNMKIESALEKYPNKKVFKIEDNPEKLKDFLPLTNFNISKENLKINEKKYNYSEEIVKNAILNSEISELFQEYIAKYGYSL